MNVYLINHHVTYKTIKEHIDSFIEVLKSNDIPVRNLVVNNIIDTYNNYVKNVKNSILIIFYVSKHRLKYNDKIKTNDKGTNKILFFNTEQINNSSKIKEFKTFNKIFDFEGVLDYDRQNIYNIKTHCDLPVFVIPFTYSSYLNKYNHRGEEYDVVFLGCKNRRRNNIIQKLQNKGLKVLYSDNIFSDRHNYYNNAKVVLDIQYFDSNHIPNIHRIVPCIYGKNIIISENLHLSGYEYIKDYAVSCNIDDMDEIVEKICLDYDIWYDKIFSNIDHCEINRENKYYMDKFIDYINIIKQNI